jgi:hypothetical protein
MKTAGQMLVFLGNGDEHVGADRYPELRLEQVYGGSVKRLDPQILLNPLEEQLELPALVAEDRNQLGFEGEVVSQNRVRLKLA